MRCDELSEANFRCWKNGYLMMTMMNWKVFNWIVIIYFWWNWCVFLCWTGMQSVFILRTQGMKPSNTPASYIPSVYHRKAQAPPTDNSTHVSFNFSIIIKKIIPIFHGDISEDTKLIIIVKLFISFRNFWTTSYCSMFCQFEGESILRYILLKLLEIILHFCYYCYH